MADSKSSGADAAVYVDDAVDDRYLESLGYKQASWPSMCHSVHARLTRRNTCSHSYLTSCFHVVPGAETRHDVLARGFQLSQLLNYDESPANFCVKLPLLQLPLLSIAIPAVAAFC